MFRCITATPSVPQCKSFSHRGTEEVVLIFRSFENHPAIPSDSNSSDASRSNPHTQAEQCYIEEFYHGSCMWGRCNHLRMGRVGWSMVAIGLSWSTHMLHHGTAMQSSVPSSPVYLDGQMLFIRRKLAEPSTDQLPLAPWPARGVSAV